MHYRQQEDTTTGRTNGVLNTRGEGYKISCAQRIIAAQRFNKNGTVENVYCDRSSIGAMRRQNSARRNGNDGKPERAILHECATTSPVLGQEYRVYHPLVSRQMPDQDFAFDSAVHGRHDWISRIVITC